MDTQETKPATDTIDYGAVEIPAKDPSDYHYTQRRAELLDIIRTKGHPSSINQSELAERYDVSPSQISRDLDRLADHVTEQVQDRERRALTVDSVVQHAVQQLLADGEHRAAVKSILEYSEWAASFSDLEQLRERVRELEEQNTDHITFQE